MATGDEQRPADDAASAVEDDAAAVDAASASESVSADDDAERPGRLPVTEVTFSMAGAASPFGDDVEFPLPVDRITYEQPSAP